jgi:hypothetical protein
MEACDTAKQTLIGMDGLMEMIQLKDEGPLREKAREIKERALLFMEEIVQSGGYFKAVEEGFFVDSGMYPERNGDGIARKADGGIGFGYVYERDEDYMAPVTAHFGYNNVTQYGGDPDRVGRDVKITPPIEVEGIAALAGQVFHDVDAAIHKADHRAACGQRFGSERLAGRRRKAGPPVPVALARFVAGQGQGSTLIDQQHFADLLPHGQMIGSADAGHSGPGRRAEWQVEHGS